MRQDYFKFGDVDSREFDALVFERDTLSTPAKQVETTTVPRRSGDLLLPGHRFANVSHSYDVIMLRQFRRNYEALRNRLLGAEGYQRLEDSFHPDEFYTAYFASAIEPDIHTRDGQAGRFRLTFTRKPQRWLKSGEKNTLFAYSSATDLKNPTAWPCYPLIQVRSTNLSGGGKSVTIEHSIGGSYVTKTTITINEYTGTGMAKTVLDLNSNSYPLCIDMETLQAYIVYGGTTYYYNEIVKYTLAEGNKYPFQMQPGENRFTPSYTPSPGGGGALWARVIPRWYTL